jgi:2-oxoglutarate ferredoxin oxidoreductase subunit alpha
MLEKIEAQHAAPAAHARRILSDINVMVAGQGGDGSLTIITLLAQMLSRRGLHLYQTSNIASRIKGGHAAAMLRGTTVPRGCMGDQIDLLVAFDPEAIQIGGPSVAADGIVIFDSSGGPPPEGFLPPTAEVISVPFSRLAVRDLRRDLFKNSLGLGLVARVIGAEDEEVNACLRKRFRRLPADVLKANLQALDKGLAYADEHGLGEGRGPWVVDEAEQTERILISGNAAVGFGFLVAGGRFYTGYPITPATDILDWLTRHLPAYGGIVIQAEDEMSAVNMALGAAMTGTRAMTGSSSPGIALMLETIGHLGSAEIPLVIVDCQRAGPSTGMPTKTEQSDFDMLAYGGNGEFPRVVLVPGDPAECFELSVLATNLSQQLQIPVFLALDRAVAQDSATVPPFDLDAVRIEAGKRLSAEEVARLGEYRRYLITEDGVSPWALPGTPGGMSLVTGNERDEWGQITTAPANRKRMVDKRSRKIETIRAQLPAGRRWGDPDAEVGLLGLGMELGVMAEAHERLTAAGIDVQCLQPRTLWPVPEETVEFVRARKRTYVIEHNSGGQVARMIGGAGAPSERMRGIRKYDGIAFRPMDVVEAVWEGERDAQ